jgi:HK97 family phage portal protein
MAFPRLLSRVFKRHTVSQSLIHLMPNMGSMAAGDPVTSTTIDWLPAVNRATSLIANDIARLPMRIASKQDDGSLIDQPGPTSKLLTEWPTQALHSHAWRRHIVREYLIHGNCICYIQKSARGGRDGRGEVLQLVPLEAGSVRIEWRDGSLVYIHTKMGDLSPAEVLHFRMPGGNSGEWGLGLLSVGREALSQLRSQQKVAASVAANTVQPRVVLKHPGKLSAEMAAAAKSKFQATFSGAGAGGTVLLQDGMSVETLAVKVTDLDFIAVCNWSIAEVSRMTGVPISLLSEHSHSTFSNVVELNRSYLDTCLSHHIAMITAELEAKIIPTTRKLDFDTTALTRGTLGDQIAAWSLAIDRGVLTRNEMRQRLGLNPIDGLDAPVLRLDTAETEEPDDEPDEEVIDD